MSQQINLFNPIFRKAGFSFTSATAMLYGVGIAVAIAALGAAYEDYRLRAVQTQAQAVDQAFKEATAASDKLTAEMAVMQKPNAQFEAALTALDVQLKARQEVIDTLNSGAVGNTEGFSEYMRAFSRQGINGLWLTAFDIAGSELALQGRTLSADLVANYLKQLNQEKALQGRRFAAMRISQPPSVSVPPPSVDSKADRGAKDKKSASPRFLDFSISTRDFTEGMQQSAQPTGPLLGAIDAGAVVKAAKAGPRQEAVQ
jgi:Tfp pilus assembly protein PilN